MSFQKSLKKQIYEVRMLPSFFRIAIVPNFLGFGTIFATIGLTLAKQFISKQTGFKRRLLLYIVYGWNERTEESAALIQGKQAKRRH